MRLHILAGVGVGLVGTELPLPLASRLALHLCTALVIGAEAFNSSLEALVNLQTQAFHPAARRAKDAAAGSVLVLAIGAVLVAGAVGFEAREAIVLWLAGPGWGWALLMDGALLLGLALLQFAQLGATRWRPALVAAIGLLLLAALTRSAALSLTAQAMVLAVLAVRATEAPVAP
jgi:diacylglycerol kinase (ATP)